LYGVVDATVPSKHGTVPTGYSVRVAELWGVQLKWTEETWPLKFDREPGEKRRERHDDWAGGHDTDKEILYFARKFPTDTAAVSVPGNSC
jgi:hypothetical protein